MYIYQHASNSTFLLLYAMLFISLTSFSAPEEKNPNSNTVNSVLGDVSFVNTFGVEPDTATPEELRIKTHLSYVIQLLKDEETRHLNKYQRQKRSRIISLLEGYKEAGQFPQNHHFEDRRPVFIDRDGNLCAVGFLIAETEGVEAAERINKDHKFDYIKDINPKLIDGWLAENGLTQKEAAMIQPAYGPGGTYKETITNNNIELEYAVGSSLLAGAQIGITSYSLFSGKATNRKVSALNGALGLASLTLGIINVDNTRKEVIVSDEEPIICVMCYDRYEYTYKNSDRTKFSVANIIVGGASAIFNGFQFFRANKQEDPSRFNVTATQLYDPSSEQMKPALSLSVNF